MSNPTTFQCTLYAKALFSNYHHADLAKAEKLHVLFASVTLFALKASRQFRSSKLFLTLCNSSTTLQHLIFRGRALVSCVYLYI
jgi:hypothetical protein